MCCCRSRIDLALLLAAAAVCLSLTVLLWLSVRHCCCCCCGTRTDSGGEDDKPNDGTYSELLGDDGDADEEAPGSTNWEARRHTESDGEEQEAPGSTKWEARRHTESDGEEQEEDGSSGAGSYRSDRYDDPDWEQHANGASRPVERDLRLEPAASEPPTLSPPVMNGDAEDPSTYPASGPPRSSSSSSHSAAAPAATLDHLRTVMKAEEMWRHRAESAESGRILDEVQAAELAEASLRERLESAGVDQMRQQDAALKAVTHELTAEGFRRRAEDAERALRAR